MRASSAISRLSKAHASRQPPAMAGPLTATTVGIGQAKIRTECLVQGVQQPRGVAGVVGQDVGHVQPGGEDGSFTGHHQGGDPGFLFAEPDEGGDLAQYLGIQGVHLVTGQGQDGSAAHP